MDNNQTTETTTPVQDSISIFPEDTKVEAQTPVSEGDKDQTQQTETPNESVADQKEASNVAEGDKAKEGEGEKTEEKKADQKDEAPKEVKLELSKDSNLTEEELQAVSEYAKEKGLSQDDAQKLLDMREESVKRFRDDQVTMVEERKAKWISDLKADKELGGENFATSVSESHRVVKMFFSEEFLKDLDNSGLGNYPEFVRGFSRIGKLIADDKLVKGGNRPGGEKTLESYFYGKT